MNPIADDILMHYGTKRHSGRFPWGSGDSPYQHSGDFLSRIEELKKGGWSETAKNIEEAFQMNTNEYRVAKAIAKNERRALDVDRARSLKEDGLGETEIGRIMGKPESTVRSLLNKASADKMAEARRNADIIKQRIDEVGMIDVGSGVEAQLGISKEKLKQALTILEMEGYPIHGGGLPQVTNPGKQTNLKVICPPGTPPSAIYKPEDIHSLFDDATNDVGDISKKAFKYPESMDSKRIKIRYADEVGADGYKGVEKDGIIEIRRGVEDLDLGNSRYAQVRILVDNNMFAKGMAIYADDIPDGYDMVFNTNKKAGTPLLNPDKNGKSVLKAIKDDPDNPFGALIKENGGQSEYIGKDGKKHLSLINKNREEGDWDEWGNKLSSQFLAKQDLSLIKRQLKVSMDDKQAEYDAICAYTNPTIKKAMLQTFADDCDSAAVHLKAASLPRQRYQVLLPMNAMKENEIYAPNYENGEKVALVRFPHAGTFEIPILTVNNKISKAKKMLGQAMDAVGINSKVAARLSGADFDGDTVMVIPTSGNGKNSKVNIQSKPYLEGLIGFEPKDQYPYHEGMKVMKNTQTEMGKISNLIADMTIKGAKEDELVRAVKHSMVVIDAEKHKLDYKKSEKENRINELKQIYQKHTDDDGYGGASTLITKSKSVERPDKSQGNPIVNLASNKGKVDYKGNALYDPKRPEGALIYKPADDLIYVDKNGKTQRKTRVSTKMAETDDARTLSSGHVKEEAYAVYANKMKSLANSARKEISVTGKIEYSPSAKQTYQREVTHLSDQLKVALQNKPKERKAQLLANAKVDAILKDNPDITKEESKKIKQRALTESRIAVGAKRETIEISDREWDAIQAGAISETLLKQIINNVDSDAIKKRATPRANQGLSKAKITRLKSLHNLGYTNAEVASSLGVSTSTITNYLKEKE